MHVHYDWRWIFLNVLLSTVTAASTKHTHKHTYQDPVSHDTIQSDVHAAPCSLLSVATSKRHVGFVKVCFNWSLHGSADIPVLWYRLFVAISVQWQSFKSVLTSSEPFTYNFSLLSFKAAILFSTNNSKRHIHTHFGHTKYNWSYIVKESTPLPIASLTVCHVSAAHHLQW